MGNLPSLPPSDDKEFWGEDAELHKNIRVEISICETHTKDRFMEHKGYIDNKDGSVKCKFCSWGSFIPGYLKVLGDRLIDLRTLK